MPRVRLTLRCGNHKVSIRAVAWTRNGNDLPGSPHFDDPTGTQFSCNPSGSNSKVFDLPSEPNDLEIIYVSDDGAQTPYKIKTERFQFGKRYRLPSPSPGRPQEPPEEDPPGDAEIEITRIKDSRCFIATAAYGSELAPPVQFLREFRDDVVLQSRFKRMFEGILDSYYTISPPIADLMRRNKPFKFLMKYVIVWPFVATAKIFAFVISLCSSKKDKD